ncbi:hypothetical protein BC936DRAFT_137327 [Jimgerdemannia flammicorona]|uniref:Uncharacterized protein n=1 Tax=Jimgerdemannia flammicorona TaxID=994334 RepID=A0A433CXN1_9FUNG|nr:hypothetical protein BC936DRAFT_137327 [Jimgerdemannia flammicorona]
MAEYCAEIELFLLLPHQRRNQQWFPEYVHYLGKFTFMRIIFSGGIFKNGIFGHAHYYCYYNEFLFVSCRPTTILAHEVKLIEWHRQLKDDERKKLKEVIEDRSQSVAVTINDDLELMTKLEVITQELREIKLAISQVRNSTITERC